jgi:hypothetical protein
VPFTVTVKSVPSSMRRPQADPKLGGTFEDVQYRPTGKSEQHVKTVQPGLQPELNANGVAGPRTAIP